MTLENCFALLLLCVQGLAALQWAPHTDSRTFFHTCVGNDVTMSWTYTVDQGEQVEDIKWFFTPAGSSTEVIIATYSYGMFMAAPQYLGRLQHNGNASITLTAAALADNGQMTVEVLIRTGTGSFSSIRHSVALEVVDPSLQNMPSMTVRQVMLDNSNNTTAQHRMQLACGPLFSRGYPPVDVIWTTPSGRQSNSSYYKNNDFHLLLDNPVEGGTYRCRLPRSAVTPLCLRNDSLVFKEVSAEVDEVRARLSVLEARELALNLHVQHENTNLRRELQELRDENMHLKKKVNQTESQVAALQASSNQHRDESTFVTFHAMLSRRVVLSLGDHLIFDNVVTNIGDAYNSSTGEFTAPVDGSYFLAFSTTPVQGSACYLMVNGTGVAYVFNGHNFFHVSTGHAAVVMRKGDKAWVENWGHHSEADGWSIFSGFLLHLDP